MQTLLVEDSEIATEIISDILKHHDIEVVTVGSGEEALNKIAGGDFAVVIIDLRLPGMDGWELARTIRESHKVPCVAITAYHSREVERSAEAKDSGFVAYFPKPVDEMTFARDLEDLVQAK